MIFIIYSDRQHLKIQMDGNFHISHLGHKFTDTIPSFSTPHSPHMCVCDTPQTKSQLTIQSDLKSPSGHTLVLNHVAQEEDHHAGVHLEGNKDPHRPQPCQAHLLLFTGASELPLSLLKQRSHLETPPLPPFTDCTLPSPEKHQSSSTASQLAALCTPWASTNSCRGCDMGTQGFPDTACHCHSNLQITEPRAQPQTAEQGKPRA